MLYLDSNKTLVGVSDLAWVMQVTPLIIPLNIAEIANMNTKKMKQTKTQKKFQVQ